VASKELPSQDAEMAWQNTSSFPLCPGHRPGYAVEKLTPAKIAKIKSRLDALQAIFSGRLDIFYPQILAVWNA
jgi:hypothetical protein